MTRWPLLGVVVAAVLGCAEEPSNPVVPDDKCPEGRVISCEGGWCKCALIGARVPFPEERGLAPPINGSSRDPYAGVGSRQ